MGDYSGLVGSRAAQFMLEHAAHIKSREETASTN